MTARKPRRPRSAAVPVDEVDLRAAPGADPVRGVREVMIICDCNPAKMPREIGRWREVTRGRWEIGADNVGVRNASGRWVLRCSCGYRPPPIDDARLWAVLTKAADTSRDVLDLRDLVP